MGTSTRTHWLRCADPSWTAFLLLKIIMKTPKELRHFPLLKVIMKTPK
jgi:hypothetical protein